MLSIAVVMLTWHNVWMTRHGQDLAVNLQAAGQAVARNQNRWRRSRSSLCIAVLREGFEVVMFLYGVLATDSAAAVEVFAGGVIGLLLGAAVCRRPTSACSTFRSVICSV